MNLVFKTDQILNKLSRSKRVPLVTFILAFLEQSISPVLPEAYVALVLSYRKDLSWRFLSLVSACGSTLGAFVTYILGYFLYASYGEKIVIALGWGQVFEKAQVLFADNVFIAQFLATLTPLPDRVFSFVAGAFGASLITVLTATTLGRLLRVSVIAYLAYEWGDEARDFIKKHTRLAVLLLAGLAALYVLYKSLA
jgi:membrane protein YqaA with SNARE-associated domain